MKMVGTSTSHGGTIIPIFENNKRPRRARGYGSPSIHLVRLRAPRGRGKNRPRPFEVGSLLRFGGAGICHLQAYLRVRSLPYADRILSGVRFAIWERRCRMLKTIATS